MRNLIVLALMSCAFSSAAQSKPAKAYFEDSKKLVQEKQLQKALSTIDQAIKQDSLNRTFLLHKVNVLYELSRCEDAITVIQKIVLNENKFDDVTVLYYSDLFDCVGMPEKATETLLEYIKTKPSPEVLTKIAQRFYAFKEYDKAVYYYREIVKKNPADIEAAIDLSKMLYGIGKKNEAKAALLNAIKANPRNVDLLNYLASYYYNENDLASAITTENQVIDISNTKENIASRAFFYEKDNQPGKAYEDYKKIIALDACNYEYYSKLLYYEMTNKLYDKVIENSQKIIACDPKKETDFLDGLYTALLFSGRNEEGLQYLNKRLEGKPTNFNPYYFKTILSISNGNYTDALKNAEFALKAKDTDRSDVLRIRFLQLGTYLLQEKYEEFAALWKQSQSKGENLTDTIEFKIHQSQEQEKTTLKSEFNKSSGAVESSLIIPVKVFKLLSEKYNINLGSVN